MKLDSASSVSQTKSSGAANIWSINGHQRMMVNLTLPSLSANESGSTIDSSNQKLFNDEETKEEIQNTQRQSAFGTLTLNFFFLKKCKKRDRDKIIFV